jgi:hypothetical protein
MMVGAFGSCNGGLGAKAAPDSELAPNEHRM